MLGPFPVSSSSRVIGSYLRIHPRHVFFLSWRGQNSASFARGNDVSLGVLARSQEPFRGKHLRISSPLTKHDAEIYRKAMHHLFSDDSCSPLIGSPNDLSGRRREDKKVYKPIDGERVHPACNSPRFRRQTFSTWVSTRTYQSLLIQTNRAWLTQFLIPI